VEATVAATVAEASAEAATEAAAEAAGVGGQQLFSLCVFCPAQLACVV